METLKGYLYLAYIYLILLFLPLLFIVRQYQFWQIIVMFGQANDIKALNPLHSHPGIL